MSLKGISIMNINHENKASVSIIDYLPNKEIAMIRISIENDYRGILIFTDKIEYSKTLESFVLYYKDKIICYIPLSWL